MAFQVPRVTSFQHRWRENTGQGCSVTQPHSGHVGGHNFSHQGPYGLARHPGSRISG